MEGFAIIVAVDSNLGIGKGGALPWKLKEDMRHFRVLTTGDGKNAVIMGRKTWESIPEKFRPLPNRINVVLTRNRNGIAYTPPGNYFTMNNLNLALAYAGGPRFVVGGGALYAEAINLPDCTDLYLTKINASFDCDTVFPRYDDRFKLSSVIGRFRESELEYSIEHWTRI